MKEKCHNLMYMSDYVEHLDNILHTTVENLLEDARKISHKEAIEKAAETGGNGGKLFG